jgi:hypothetical protein
MPEDRHMDKKRTALLFGSAAGIFGFPFKRLLQPMTSPLRYKAVPYQTDRRENTKHLIMA